MDRPVKYSEARIARQKKLQAKSAIVLVVLSLLGALSVQTMIPGTASGYNTHAPILISGDTAFTPANGVTGGTGTSADPYIIEGWGINASSANGIKIQNTNAYFIIRNVKVQSGLKTSGSLTYSGIYLFSASNAVIQNIVASNNSRGVFVGSSSRITIWGGSASNNRDGIYILSSSQVTVSGWNVTSNSRDGIRVYQSSQSIVTGNNVSSNQEVGISLYDSSNVTVRLNRVDSNSLTGMSLSLTTETNVYHNSITNNAEQAYDDLGPENSWDRGYPAGGNYWSAYTGQDIFSGPDQSISGADGIGDAAYIIDGDSQDRYPLMIPYHDSNAPVWAVGSYLMQSQVTTTSVTLFWTSAVDENMVMVYRLYQDGVLMAVLPNTLQTYTVTGLNPGTLYMFKVESGDESDNWTQNGPALGVTTLSTVSGGGGGRFFPV